MYQSVVTLKFNDTLRSDPEGVYSVFWADKFNTPDAILIKEGNTFNVTSVSFEIPNFPPGAELAFTAIGHWAACYVEQVKLIKPGEQTVWLCAEKEMYYV